MTDLLQDAIVTAVALGAGVIVARRVLGFVAVRDTAGQGCDKCAAAPAQSPTTSRAGNQVPVYPVTLIRPSRKA